MGNLNRLCKRGIRWRRTGEEMMDGEEQMKQKRRKKERRYKEGVERRRTEGGTCGEEQ